MSNKVAIVGGIGVLNKDLIKTLSNEGYVVDTKIQGLNADYDGIIRGLTYGNRHLSKRIIRSCKPKNFKSFRNRRG